MCMFQNRMDLAKTLFKTYINNQWLRTCGIVLLLNKKDILEEKIMVSHLVDYYPEFKGEFLMIVYNCKYFSSRFIDSLTIVWCS